MDFFRVITSIVTRLFPEVNVESLDRHLVASHLAYGLHLALAQLIVVAHCSVYQGI